MSNALKIPFSPDDDWDETHTEEVVRENFSKYKRPLLMLFLLVLGIAVFIAFVNQKKQIVTAKKLPEPTSVAPSESKEATPASPPSADKSGPPKFLPALSKNDNVRLAYKGDMDYLSLNRYERFKRAEKNPVETNKQKVRDTVSAGDKPLTLAGRGFDINRFSSQSRTGRHVGFIDRLQRPLPKMEPVPEDHLDLKLTQAKSSKDLIFHPLRQALSDGNRQMIDREDEKLDIEKPKVLADIPETKLLFMEGEKSFLILRRGGESLDLLSGNEKINRKKYNRW